MNRIKQVQIFVTKLSLNTEYSMFSRILNYYLSKNKENKKACTLQ